MNQTSDPAPVVSLLARAFFDDPEFVWMFPDAADRERRLRVFMGAFYTHQYAPHGHCYVNEQRTEVTYWLPPRTPFVGPREFVKMFPPVARVLGTRLPDVLLQLAHTDKLQTKEPHYHLGEIGVLPDQQGKGLGSEILQPVLELADREQMPCALECTNPKNHLFYQRHGFTIRRVGTSRFHPTVWFMQRDPQTKR